MNEENPIERLVSDELERLKDNCMFEGSLVESRVDEYRAWVVKFSRMGYSVLKHELTSAKYRKELNKRRFDKNGYYK